MRKGPFPVLILHLSFFGCRGGFVKDILCCNLEFGLSIFILLMKVLKRWPFAKLA